jgi:hypothetical protein
MITIIKGNKKFEFQNSELASIDTIYDGVFLKFADQTELKFNFSVKNGLSSVLDIVGRCQQDVTVNMNEAAIGNLSRVVTIGKHVIPDSKPVIPSEVKQVSNVSPEDIINKLTKCVK